MILGKPYLRVALRSPDQLGYQRLVRTAMISHFSRRGQIDRAVISNASLTLKGQGHGIVSSTTHGPAPIPVGRINVASRTSTSIFRNRTKLFSLTRTAQSSGGVRSSSSSTLSKKTTGCRRCSIHTKSTKARRSGDQRHSHRARANISLSGWASERSVHRDLSPIGKLQRILATGIQSKNQQSNDQVLHKTSLLNSLSQDILKQSSIVNNGINL